MKNYGGGREVEINENRVLQTKAMTKKRVATASQARFCSKLVHVFIILICIFII